ncbi:MAG: hypothetical protein LQ348_002771 [Seirophora lacunosa]|nr:MAG: hypothetical protein LQ344_003563 [Seirophora lacunosa]KAI4193793.1 MAG: hypothetical protein LQ348_002771 [Seirophora lacunosa]
MASPTYRSPATSPQYPSSATLPNPKKRPSLSVTSHPPAAKRRKPTNASQASTPATSHPLRQTSFPPEESAVDIGERSPSVESDVTGVTGLTGHQSIMTSGTQQRKPRKRGRKRKTEDTSVVSGGKAAVADAASAAGQVADEAEDDDDDGEENEGVMGDQEKQQKRKERADLAFLIEHFNEDQLHRYEAMRRNKFRKETVRRIVNQTLSQSVPPSVVIGISGYTKLLVGLLIERARDVQEQHAAVAAAAYPSPPSDRQSTRPPAKQADGAPIQENALQSSSFDSSATFLNDGALTASSFDRQSVQQDTESDTDRPPEINHNDIFGSFSSPPQPLNLPLPPEAPVDGLKPLPSPSRYTSESYDAQIPRGAQASRQLDTRFSPEAKKPTKAKDSQILGPLLPDDLREAFRRHKRNGETAGIGQGGLSLMGIGVQGTFAGGRGKGRRLFG